MGNVRHFIRKWISTPVNHLVQADNESFQFNHVLAIIDVFWSYNNNSERPVDALAVKKVNDLVTT